MSLDPFISYRNLSTSGLEDVPVVPEGTYAVKQGYINNYVLVANDANAIAVPTDARFVLFNADSDIWVKIGGVAEIPTINVTDGTGSELNPAIRYLDTATTIGIISESATKLSLMFYK